MTDTCGERGSEGGSEGERIGWGHVAMLLGMAGDERGGTGRVGGWERVELRG